MPSSTGRGEVAHELAGAELYDVVPAGPHGMGALEADGGVWRSVRFTVAPSPELSAGNTTGDQATMMQNLGASVALAGDLTCGGTTVTFEWIFDTATTYTCDPTNLVVGASREASSQLTVHGDHLFYDSLVDPDAGLQAQAYVDADADEDGVLTMEELRAAPIAPTGLDVGGQSGIETLWDYLSAQTTTLGHIDGEGHCDVSVR